MKLTDKNSEIRIYQSVWKNTFYAICCLAFAIVGYLIIINPSTKWPTKIFWWFAEYDIFWRCQCAFLCYGVT